MKTFAAVTLGLAAVFLIAPLLTVVVFSFNTAEASADMRGFTLRWYGKTLGNPAFRHALLNSLIVSLLVTLISGLIGTSAALAAHFSPNPRTRPRLAALCLVPILTPELLMAVGAAQVFDLVGVPFGLHTIVIGHTSFGVPLFFLLIDAALQAGRFDDLIRASRDLGASVPTTLRRIVLPLLSPYLIATAVLIWALSIDEFVLSFFLSGESSPVLTVRLFSLLRTRGVSTEINVACVILMLLVVIVGAAAMRLRRRNA